VRKFEIPVTFDARGVRPSPAISPDGSRIVLIEEGHLSLRELDRIDARSLAGTEGADAVFWSPDGQQLGFFASGKLWKVPVTGGSPTVICDFDGGILGGTGACWGPSGRIVFSQGGTGIFEVSSRGGDARIVVDIDPKLESDLHDPSFLPDERGILFVSHRLRTAPNVIEVQADGRRRVLLEAEGASLWFPNYAPSGHIIFRRTGGATGLWALPFSLERLEATGEPFLIAQEGHHPSVSTDGSLLYVNGDPQALHQLAWVSRDGVVEETVGEPMDQIDTPVLSPDGRRAAVGGIDIAGENWDVWVLGVDRPAQTRFTFAPSREDTPEWTPDGKYVVYNDVASQTLMIRAADGSGVARALCEGAYPTITPDGADLVYSVLDPESKEDIWTRPLHRDAEPTLVYGSPGRDIYPRVSPDGRYLLYLSDESGNGEIYIRPFPAGDGRWQVSTSGGSWPRWSPTGDRVYFLGGGVHIMEARVEFDPAPVVDAPRVLFATDSLRVKTFGRTGYDIAPDQHRLLMIRLVNPVVKRSAVTFVENWHSEFKDNNNDR
jgi:serine/threonine-protein kinase